MPRLSEPKLTVLTSFDYYNIGGNDVELTNELLGKLRSLGIDGKDFYDRNFASSGCPAMSFNMPDGSVYSVYPGVIKKFSDVYQYLTDYYTSTIAFLVENEVTDHDEIDGQLRPFDFMVYVAKPAKEGS